MDDGEYFFIGGMINGQHCMVLNPKHPSWTKEEDELYRRDFHKPVRSDVTHLENRTVGTLCRRNGRDLKRFSLPDVMSLCVPETPEEEILLYCFSTLWVGRVL